jgi:hypothetical protein
MRKTAISFLTLLASSSTLFCCAIPALFVLLGAGSTLASLMSAYPFLSGLSAHKTFLFGFSTIMLTLSGIWQYRQRFAPCPTDPVAARACRTTRRTGLVIYSVSVILYVTGVAFAFVIPRLMEMIS